jgi:hypothetical protein
MIIEAAKLALEALGWTDEWRPQGLKERAITALRTAIETYEKQEPAPGYCKHCKQYTIEEPLPAQPAPLQVSPADFVDMVMDKEDAVGKPIFWAQWPNREKNGV